MIDVSDQNEPRELLLLKMALQTKRCVPFLQQALIDRAVRRVACRTALAHRLMWKNKRARLRGVALKTGFLLVQERDAAAFERLLNICLCTFDRDALMGVVTVSTTHFPFQHGMMVRQLELCPHFQVALKTSFRRFSWIYDRTGATAGFHVQTSWPMARLTAYVLRILPLRFQSGVRRCSEVAHDRFVAGSAFLRADKLRAGDAGRSENCAVSRAAGKQNDG